MNESHAGYNINNSNNTVSNSGRSYFSSSSVNMNPLTSFEEQIDEHSVASRFQKQF